MLISIVIPAYNAAKTIAETLDSLPPALSHPYEIIISDDGSTDGTADIVAKHPLAPHCTILRNPNRGPGAARNAGLAAARGDYIIFVDADDRLLPNAVDRLLIRLENDPSAVLAYGNYVNIDKDGNRTGKRHWLNGLLPRPQDDCLVPMLRANFIVNPGAALIRHAPLKDSGGLDPSLRYSQDWELFVRLSLAGPFLHLPGAPVLEYRRFGQSSTAAMQKTVDQLLHSVDKIFKNPAILARLTPAQAKSLEAACRAHAQHLLSIREARHGSFRRAFGFYLESIRLCPARFLPLSLRFFGNVLRIL